jgi:hypothetical protein
MVLTAPPLLTAPDQPAGRLDRFLGLPTGACLGTHPRMLNCRAAEGRGLPVGEVPRGLVNHWLTKSSEHQVIATEPEQARAGSRTRGRPVSRPGGLFQGKGEAPVGRL